MRSAIGLLLKSMFGSLWFVAWCPNKRTFCMKPVGLGRCDFRATITPSLDVAIVAQRAQPSSAPMPPTYRRYARYWEWLGYPAFVAMLAVYFLMVVKPGF